MKIALIYPKTSFLSKNPRFNDFWAHSEFTRIYRRNWSGIGSGLLVIGALTPASYQIELIDDNFEEIDFSQRYDLVGITVMTPQATRAYEIADRFRKNNVTVVLGGIHVSVLPDEAIQHADSVVIGEAEYLWNELLDDFAGQRLKPFYKSERIVDLKDSPVPKFSLLASKSPKMMWVQTTRGCPHDCEFCGASKLFGAKYRTKTVDQVIDEITLIRQCFGNVCIGFADDNFVVNKKFSRVIFEKLISLEIKWVASTDIAVARDDELLALLKRSGCIQLLVGLESLSEDNLRAIDRHGWKAAQLRRYPEYIRKIQSYGIGVIGLFIVGLDHDDAGVVDMISDFIMDNHLYDAQITIATPLPGTRLRDRMSKEDRLLPTTWSDYTLFDVTFKHPRLSREQIEDGLLKIYKRINNESACYTKMSYFKQIQKDLILKGLS